MAFVLVEFDFEYKAKDGRHICIKPNERYVLVSKTNDHWWRVSKDQDSKPFYIPAEYVKEVSAPPGTSSGPKKTESPKSLTKRKPADATGKNKAVNTTKRTSLDTKTVTHPAVQDDSKETYRFSTFGLNLPAAPVPAELREREGRPLASRRAGTGYKNRLSELGEGRERVKSRR
uniref:SH3 domain-containing protein n=1 Tax=Poecilia latipinna TaxID=48699 RepID=A0A3B3V7Y7_9TELE